MENEEYVKNFNRVILGIVVTKDNGDKVYKNFPGRQILGYYRAENDITTDFYGRIISKGDTGMALIMGTNK